MATACATISTQDQENAPATLGSKAQPVNSASQGTGGRIVQNASAKKMDDAMKVFGPRELASVMKDGQVLAAKHNSM